MKHVKPPKQKSWIVARDPANDDSNADYGSILDGQFVRPISAETIVDGYYDNLEDARTVAYEWRDQYPTMKISVFCHDESLFDLPPGWDPNAPENDKGGFDAIMARSQAMMDIASARIQDWTPEERQAKEKEHEQGI